MEDMAIPWKFPVIFVSMKHHTKTKGDLGVLKAMADLGSKGYLILTPFSEHAPFDIVIYKENIFIRVQVKSRSIDKNGCLTVRFENNYATSKGVQMKKVDKNMIDLYCVYCIDNDTCYYFKPSESNITISLRVSIPKNNQKQNIRYAIDYREVP